jgi:hypothetical protein
VRRRHAAIAFLAVPIWLATPAIGGAQPQPGKVGLATWLCGRTLASTPHSTAVVIPQLREVGWIEGQSLAIEDDPDEGQGAASAAPSDPPRVKSTTIIVVRVHELKVAKAARGPPVATPTCDAAPAGLLASLALVARDDRR